PIRGGGAELKTLPHRHLAFAFTAPSRDHDIDTRRSLGAAATGAMSEIRFGRISRNLAATHHLGQWLAFVHCALVLMNSGGGNLLVLRFIHGAAGAAPL